MSFSYLKIIPNDPTYVPDQLSQDKAKNFLSDIYKGVIKLEATENIEFIDQGDGFESVSCNKCGKEIDIEYWQEAMNSSYEQHFKNRLLRNLQKQASHLGYNLVLQPVS